MINYDASSEDERFNKQKAKFPFQKIWFDKLKWSELEKVMNIYKQILFSELCDFEEPKIEPVIEEKRRYANQLDFTVPKIKAKKQAIRFKFPLMKTLFRLGYVEIEKRLEGFSDKTTIKIENSNIIPEFDYVKPYFAKALGKRKIEVTGTLEIDEKGAVKIACQSKEINQINEELISTVKTLRLKDSIFKPKIVEVDKSLFTPEEYFDSLEDEQLGNVVRSRERDLLDEILQLEGIRNRNQLLYLSGKLQSNKAGLRFTLSPEFGFLFYVEGEEMDHFIWELLNTNATYIWSIEKEGTPLKEKYKLVERTINFIRENGRRTYLNAEKSNDLLFSKINHGNSKKGVVDGFPRWKVRVNEKII